ncbi:MAG TPA: DUF4290 domain-containing protein [Flavobacterium sp.]|nr:DUF4290 domain-containing protein [Flavobacterium sp.]
MQANTNSAIFELEYNTERVHLKIPEYGRHIHKLINNVKTIENRDERNKAAKQVIKIMGEMNPHLRDVPDFQHMLWDQLFFMADFDLDVDSPYPIPTKEDAYIHPVQLDYPQQFPKYRFYGNNITRMIEEAINWEEGEKKDALIVVIANHMKKSYLSWNKETVTDEVIFQHLLELSNRKINLLKKDEELTTSSDLLRINKKQNNRFNQNKNTQNNNNNKPRHHKNKIRK